MVYVSRRAPFVTSTMATSSPGKDVGSLQQVQVNSHRAYIVQVACVTVARWILDLKIVRSQKRHPIRALVIARINASSCRLHFVQRCTAYGATRPEQFTPRLGVTINHSQVPDVDNSRTRPDRT